VLRTKWKNCVSCLREINYDIIGIIETWANSNISDSEISIEGYNMFRVDRKEGKGSGAILYIAEK